MRSPEDSPEWAQRLYLFAVGNNDGSVDGIRYFLCPPRKGLFVKPETVVRVTDAFAPEHSDEVGTCVPFMNRTESARAGGRHI